MIERIKLNFLEKQGQKVVQKEHKLRLKREGFKERVRERKRNRERDGKWEKEK